jgi:hypothetical protein
MPGFSEIEKPTFILSDISVIHYFSFLPHGVGIKSKPRISQQCF